MKSNSTQSKIHLQGYGSNKLQSLAGIFRFIPLKILSTKALNIDLSNLQSGIYMATISLQKDGKEVIKTIRLIKGNN